MYATLWIMRMTAAYCTEITVLACATAGQRVEMELILGRLAKINEAKSLVDICRIVCGTRTIVDPSDCLGAVNC